MKLQIHNKQGTFEIIGSFTSENSEMVKDHFNYLLDHYEEVVMCLHKVKKIDQKALQVLRHIYKKASKRSKILFILGKKNKIVAKAFNKNELNYIFRNDY